MRGCPPMTVRRIFSSVPACPLPPAGFGGVPFPADSLPRPGSSALLLFAAPLFESGFPDSVPLYRSARPCQRFLCTFPVFFSGISHFRIFNPAVFHRVFCVFVFSCFCVFVFSCFCVFVFLCFRVFVFLCFLILLFLCFSCFFHVILKIRLFPGHYSSSGD